MYRLQNIDVLEGLRSLEDESVDVIITSPPYNKAGLNGNYNKKHKRTIDYGGDVEIDNKPEEEYQKWQLDILNECYRVLKKDGMMFYNHKNRIVRGKGCISTPYEWLLKSPFLIRQEIIWDRKCGCNTDPSRFVPIFESIYVLTKTKDVCFYRNKEAEFKTDIWTINPDKKNDHPAPFPIEIPRNILSCITKEKAIVLDPFNGSGTTGVAAIERGFDYVGFDIIDEYLQETEKRIIQL